MQIGVPLKRNWVLIGEPDSLILGLFGVVSKPDFSNNVFAFLNKNVYAHCNLNRILFGGSRVLLFWQGYFYSL